MTVLLVIWAWLQKWWKWLLPAIGAAFWLLGRLGRKTTVVVVSPELTEHEKLSVAEENKAQLAETVAAASRDHKVEVINQDYDVAIKKMDETDEQRRKVLENDPIALNEFLKKTGANVHRS